MSCKVNTFALFLFHNDCAWNCFIFTLAVAWSRDVRQSVSTVVFVSREVRKDSLVPKAPRTSGGRFTVVQSTWITWHDSRRGSGFDRIKENCRYFYALIMKIPVRRVPTPGPAAVPLAAITAQERDGRTRRRVDDTRPICVAGRPKRPRSVRARLS